MTYSDERGTFIWRYVGGRRIKIYTGQSLPDAMRESGKFPSGKTSDAEKQRKIDSVNIDFDRDNTLPGLNKEDLEELGVEDKPVLLKKSIIDKNLKHHPEVKIEDYNKILGQSLYDPDLIVPGHDDKPYYNFVARVGEDKNTVVLLQVKNTNSGNMEIVNLHWSYDRQRGSIKAKGDKIKKQGK